MSVVLGVTDNPRALSEKVCHLLPSSTDCELPMLSWYFDATKKRCATFVYGGCGGNANRFSNKNDCENFCYTFGEKCWTEDLTGDYLANCGSNSCLNKECLSIPEAKCLNNNCTNCGFAFFDKQGRDVTDQCHQQKVLLASKSAILDEISIINPIARMLLVKHSTGIFIYSIFSLKLSFSSQSSMQLLGFLY